MATLAKHSCLSTSMAVLSWQPLPHFQQRWQKKGSCGCGSENQPSNSGCFWISMSRVSEILTCRLEVSPPQPRASACDQAPSQNFLPPQLEATFGKPIATPDSNEGMSVSQIIRSDLMIMNAVPY